jgi:tetratricopeptide (TPR) repeat protein
VLAECDLLEGRPERACARLAPLLDRAALEDADVSPLLAAFAWAQLELGKVAAAAEIVGRAITLARARNDRFNLVNTLRVRTLVAMRQGQWAEAELALEEGLALARRIPYPYAEARLWRIYGEMHARKDETESARERLEAALAIFRLLGARKDAERVEQTLAAL